jgi:hypothetical protein
MRLAQDKAAHHSLARTLAAAVGAPLVAFTVGAAVMALAPGGVSFALGFHVVVPLWVALACGLPLVRDGRTAWGMCLAVLVPLGAWLAWRARG